jgi:hypothetical protein
MKINMFNCFSIEYIEGMTEEEIKELIKKEVTLKGLILGKPLETKFQIIKTIKEVGGQKYIFIFVFEQDKNIDFKNREELYLNAILFLEENINSLKAQKDM